MPGEHLHRGVVQRAPDVEPHVLVPQAAALGPAALGLVASGRAQGAAQARVPRHVLLEVDDHPAARGPGRPRRGAAVTPQRARMAGQGPASPRGQCAVWVSPVCGSARR